MLHILVKVKLCHIRIGGKQSRLPLDRFLSRREQWNRCCRESQALCTAAFLLANWKNSLIKLVKNFHKYYLHKVLHFLFLSRGTWLIQQLTVCIYQPAEDWRSGGSALTPAYLAKH